MPWALTKGMADHVDAIRDELVADFSGMEVGDCFFHAAKEVRDKVGSFYKPLIAGVRWLHQLPSTIVHEQKKRDMLGEWSQWVCHNNSSVHLKEYVGTSWWVATLPARCPTTNNVQEAMNSGVKCV